MKSHIYAFLGWIDQAGPMGDVFVIGWLVLLAGLLWRGIR